MNVEPHKTYVGCLRTTTHADDTSAYAARLRAAIAPLDLHPQGLPAQTVVCLRRLPAPLPANILAGDALDRARLRDWEAQTTGALQAAIGRGVRPAHEFVPAAAECIVFADAAELLACLARDWCDGQTQARWWWRSLFKRSHLTDSPVHIWLRTPEYVPGAFAHLARQGYAIRFSSTLTTNEVNGLLAGLITHFALHGLVPLLTSDRGAFTTGPPAAAQQAQRSAGALKGQMPWSEFVPESVGAALSTAQQCLLGLGLMLQRAPAHLRTDSFARAVERWLGTHVELARGTTDFDVTETETSDSSRPTHVSADDATAAMRAHRPDRPPHLGALSRAADSAAVQLSSRTADSHSQVATDHGVARPAGESDKQSSADSGAAQISAAAACTPAQANSSLSAAGTMQATGEFQLAPLETESASALSAMTLAGAMSHVTGAATHDVWAASRRAADSMRAQDAAMRVDVPLEAQIETRFGGLFFLLNLAQFLELYGDFTRPLAPGLSLSVWDFVALVGERLLGPTLRADAVWGLLAQLAGHDAEAQPGADFTPTDEWRMPATWLKPFAHTDAWCWTVARRRLQVRHTAGFLVLDLPRDARPPAAQLAAELEAYSGYYFGALERAPRGLTDLHRGQTSLDRWLERLTAYVRIRLGLALGLRRPRAAAARLLCTLRARVVVTTTHLDVFMGLNELPIAVRLSGLDRDPGWIPAAGRFVAFHFV